MVAPLLRFTEFTDDWEETTLENLAEVERGKFSVRPRNDPRYFDGEMPFVQTGDVAGSDMYLKGYSQTLNADGIKVSKVFPADTILITIAANIGDTTITRYAVACPDSVVAIQSKKDKANTIFLKNLIDLQKEVLDSQATQNAQKNINLQVLKPLELFAPSIEEQTKIASFLSNVDEKISQLTQKHELLSQYKQGMMQKLFSQHIRFKADDGSEFGEWEELKFKDVIKIKYGKDHKKLEDGDIPVLGTGGIMRYVDSYLYDGESILIGRKGTIDKPQFISGKFWTVDTLFYTEIGEKIQPKFAFQQLLLVNWLNLNEATGVPSLNTTSIGNIELKVPNLKEQTKIANFLSAIDQKIEVVAQQIEQAKTWKKGLLQQMFV
ncbi:restriction endonuclease subunit S [Acinetobacter baumannii]|uniref:restriction endonuclease subunit S n=1 Tax=Acinetobacter sp. YH12103 TaxID=2601092 RepID=UPI0015D218E2|nr:restriction endonuclease subunit S [Acinetobacter sp. YH12103]MDC4313822.1 restriction endonuclease subunit S [Acinetobacter baumannii]